MDIKSIQDDKTSRTFVWIGAGITVTAVAADVANGNLTDDFDNSVSFATDLAFSTVQNLAFTLVDARAGSNYYRNAIPSEDEIPIPSNRFFWLDHALRITTIQPGQKVFGKIAFPRNDAATVFNFNVTVNRAEFKFPFTQQLFKP